MAHARARNQIRLHGHGTAVCSAPARKATTRTSYQPFTLACCALPAVIMRSPSYSPPPPCSGAYSLPPCRARTEQRQRAHEFQRGGERVAARCAVRLCGCARASGKEYLPLSERRPGPVLAAYGEAVPWLDDPARAPRGAHLALRVRQAALLVVGSVPQRLVTRFPSERREHLVLRPRRQPASQHVSRSRLCKSTRVRCACDSCYAYTRPGPVCSDWVTGMLCPSRSPVSM